MSINIAVRWQVAEKKLKNTYTHTAHTHRRLVISKKQTLFAFVSIILLKLTFTCVGLCQLLFS